MSAGEKNHAIRSVLAGTVAGAAGTAAMDLVWFVRYRLGGGQQKLLAWETAQGVDTWDKASSPGQFGRLVIERLTGRKLPDKWARSTTNLAHWVTGVRWGAQFGLLNGPSRRHFGEYALLLGPAAWLTSYVVLPLAKVYKPIWDYDAKTLGNDLSAHFVYGAITGATFAMLTRSMAKR
jgi:hypothetical protein